MQEVATFTVGTPYTTFDYTPYGQSAIKYFEMMNDRIQIEIDIDTSLRAAIARGLEW